ncbi:hypothetical protein BDV09DRAFT_186011 [Aspergillus tetrazonus]
MSANEASTEAIIDEAGRGFLGYLTPSVIRYRQYCGEDQFLNDFKDAFETDTREWFLVTGVNKETFTKVFFEPEFGPFSSWSSYDAELELLLVRMVKLGNQKHLPRGRSQDWPSAVLEDAFSEAKAKLQTDVRYWLRASEGDVKIVFTIQIDHNVPKITIEKWNQTSPLRIGFQKLFLRSPSTLKERDVEIGEEELQLLAEDV